MNKFFIKDNCLESRISVFRYEIFNHQDLFIPVGIFCEVSLIQRRTSFYHHDVSKILCPPIIFFSQGKHSNYRQL